MVRFSLRAFFRWQGRSFGLRPARLRLAFGLRPARLWLALRLVACAPLACPPACRLRAFDLPSGFQPERLRRAGYIKDRVFNKEHRSCH
jgi:hypothetical protein